ncbi:MAG: hypothetical protein H0U21_10665 [Acidimicrobiia bacterium]|nr:hypothetical protein [Acidimicrobiia bacterium]
MPVQVDRADFARPDAPWLVVVFTSATCQTCAKVVSTAAVLTSAEVVVEEVEYGARGDVQRRYGIEAVPTVVIADAAGVVRTSIQGPVNASDLWAAMATVRAAPDAPEV